MIERPIFLCGFMGVGKSTVGKLLGSKLKLSFVDTDELITKKAKLSIAQIFSTQGEAVFREHEREVIFSLDTSKAAVIALGGGSLSLQRNINFIRKSGYLVYLSADLNELEKRLQDTADSRPLLQGKSKPEQAEKIKSLLQERVQSYRQAEFCIDTNNKNPEQVAEDILTSIQGVKS